MSVYFDKKRGRWRAKLEDPRSGMVRVTLHLPGPPSRWTRKLAEAAEAELLEEWSREAAKPKQEPIGWDDWLSAALADPGIAHGEQLATSSRDRREIALRRWVAWVRDLEPRPDRVTPAVVARYVEHRRTVERPRKDAEPVIGVANSTIRRELASLRRAYAWLVEARVFPRAFENPVTRQIRPARTDARGRAWTDAEADLLLEAMSEGFLRDVVVDHKGRKWEDRQKPPGYLLLVWGVLSETGMRPGELLPRLQYGPEKIGLQWTAVDLERKVISIADPTSKTKGHEVPMTDRLVEVLAGLPRSGANVVAREDGSPVTYNAARLSLRRLCGNLKIPNRGWHGLRHRFAVELADRGCPIARLQELLGHTDIRTSSVYLRSRLDDFGDEFRRLKGG